MVQTPCLLDSIRVAGIGEIVMQLPVRNLAGETVGEIDLRDDIFSIEPNIAVMHQASVRQMANARLGTHKTKKRSEVRGGGRKPWRQKGTGRARQGSIRAPQWKGGGTVFGPVPRSYRKKMNRKMRRLALCSALSIKAGEEQILVLEDLALPSHKTKEMKRLMQRLSLDSSVLVLLDRENAAVELSARNLSNIKTLRTNCLSVRDLLIYDYVLMPLAAVDAIHSWLGASEKS